MVLFPRPSSSFFYLKICGQERIEEDAVPGSDALQCIKCNCMYLLLVIEQIWEDKEGALSRVTHS